MYQNSIMKAVMPSMLFLIKQTKKEISKYCVMSTEADENLSMIIKFIFSKKATKIDKIFTIDLTFTTYRQIDGEDFFKSLDLLGKHKLYKNGGIFSVVRYCLEPSK